MLGKTARWVNMRTIPIFVSMCFLVGCQEHATSPNVPLTRVSLSYSHDDSVEAKDLALWFGGTVTPRDSLVDQMLYSLNYLRYVYLDSTQLFPVSLPSQRFLAPWRTHYTSIKFNSATAQLVRSNQYTAWNTLPASVRPDSVGDPDILGWTVAWYADIRNPWRICEFYSVLPGVLGCEPDGITSQGGTFPIFPGIQAGEMTFIFVQNPFLLPSAYHYFYYHDGQPIYGGVWRLSMDPKPAWYQHAKASIDTFYTWCKSGPL
jgi:hypothetical protein